MGKKVGTGDSALRGELLCPRRQSNKNAAGGRPRNCIARDSPTPGPPDTEDALLGYQVIVSAGGSQDTAHTPSARRWLGVK